MHEEKTTCDACGKDLSSARNIEDWRLVLFTEARPKRGAGVYTMAHKPMPLERAHHFCGLKCLDKWREEVR